MVAWGCRAQKPQGLQAYEQRENVIALSGALGEPFRQQAARPQSLSYYRLWQPRQPQVEAEEEACCWTSLARQQLGRRGFGTDFAGWSLALRRCPAYALQHSRESCRDSADSSPGHCAAGRCCSAPPAAAIQVLGPCQTIVAQTAADWPGARGSGCVLQSLQEQAEWAH